LRQHGRAFADLSDMRWDRSHESSNVEDRRSEGAPVGLAGGGGLGLLIPLAMRFGWPGILVAIVLVLVSRGVDCGGAEAPSSRAVAPEGRGASADEKIRFVGFVFDDVQSTFARAYAAEGKPYREATMVVFRDGVRSECGVAPSSVGPFYCPLDHKVYIDLAFYGELSRRFGAPGDFAQAYVIGHEVGHHLQNLHGGLSGRGREGSVETELQADCLAGVWAADAERRNLLEAGDLEEAMTAAAAIGDDAIQRKTTGTVQPETWTHGSSEQRQAAYRKGYRGRTLAACGM
jgi:predicted metalloprotease